jgi:hypothetical protein
MTNPAAARVKLSVQIRESIAQANPDAAPEYRAALATLIKLALKDHARFIEDLGEDEVEDAPSMEEFLSDWLDTAREDAQVATDDLMGRLDHELLGYL